MKKRRLDILVSPGFLAGLCLLLLNDFLFKQLFHNWLTGKLSDFSGLFIFPLFWAALLPRYKRAIYLLTALLFVFWKSTYSQPFIDLWSQWLFPISRVEDSTDLLALLVLPLSYAYGNLEQKTAPHKFVPYFIGCLSLFAFTATSYINRVDYDEKRYEFTETKALLVDKAEWIDEGDDAFEFRAAYPHKLTENPTNQFHISLRPGFCDYASATVEIKDQGASTIILLEEITYPERCRDLKDEKEHLLAVFEKDFINKLRGSLPLTNKRSQPTPR